MVRMIGWLTVGWFHLLLLDFLSFAVGDCVDIVVAVAIAASRCVFMPDQ